MAQSFIGQAAVLLETPDSPTKGLIRFALSWLRQAQPPPTISHRQASMVSLSNHQPADQMLFLFCLESYFFIYAYADLKNVKKVNFCIKTTPEQPTAGVKKTVKIFVKWLSKINRLLTAHVDSTIPDATTVYGGFLAVKTCC